MKIQTLLLSALAVVGATFLSLEASAQDKAQKPAQTADAAVVKAQLPSYPLTTCPVSGEKLENPVDAVAAGRLGRFCCGDCAASFKKDPAKVIAKIDAAVVAQQKAAYPLKTCPLSGEALGDDAVNVVAGTKLVRVCCKRCEGAVKKDATKAMAKVDAAWIEAGRKSYPSDVCPVSSEKLGSMGDPIEVLYGTRLVKLCCKGCVKTLDKDPLKVLATIDAQAAGKKTKKEG